jgi:hypothetical protein
MPQNAQNLHQPTYFHLHPGRDAESLFGEERWSTEKREVCIINNYPWTGSSMVEQLTLNQRVAGSSPARFTKISNKTKAISH